MSEAKPSVAYNILGIPLRFVDTAGWEEPGAIDRRRQSDGTSEKALLELMIKQTRTALIYSDLALFVVDSREGIGRGDTLLAQWLRSRLQIGKRKGANEKTPRTIEERKAEYEELVKQGEELVPGTNIHRVSRKKLNRKIKEIERKAREIREMMLTQVEDDVRVPPILLLANKTEDGFKGEVDSQFQALHMGNPIFVSGEHGDGIVL